MSSANGQKRAEVADILNGVLRLVLGPVLNASGRHQNNIGKYHAVL